MPDWPTREQWAERHRAAYWDGDSPHPYTAKRDLDLYACPEEVEDAIAALKKLWSDYGRQMRAEGEDVTPWLRDRRTGINKAIKQLHEGKVPGEWMGWIPEEKLRAARVRLDRRALRGRR
jgi:hypothetical protein